jgi:CRISPR-associated protein Cas1
MIKKILHFGSAVYLSTQHRQLIVTYPETKAKQERSIAIEDIGVIMLDHPQITISHPLIRLLLDHNAIIISCDDRHMPSGIMQSSTANKLRSKIVRAQLNASQPLRKQLWQQTVKAKINNQAGILRRYGLNYKAVSRLSRRVLSGDPANIEGQAASKYWDVLVSPDWTRDRDGIWPNPILNYGYAILRSLVSRALIGSGLILISGIHHRNQYNPYCLADDIMEPYRPYVDGMVYEWLNRKPTITELNMDTKKYLLSLAQRDVQMADRQRPLMAALSESSASLAKCFTGQRRKLKYPEIL